MSHRTGQDRLQFCLFTTPLDEMIPQDNIVRVIDAFVDAIDLDKLGFTHVTSLKRGAPLHNPAKSYDATEFSDVNQQKCLRNGVKISFQFQANYFGVSQLSFEANSRAI